jgi:hypothetical protein
MTDVRRNPEKLLKKDQSGVRETREEIAEEIGSSDVQPTLKNPNRDRARGDWDRSGDHHHVEDVEDVGQAEETE